MIFRRAMRIILVLAATAALAQSANPGTTPGAPMLSRQTLAARRGAVGNKTAEPQGLVAMHQRVGDMESTVSQMRAVLKQMQAKLAKSKTTDSVSKANLDMWELMVGHLDKELEQLRATLAAREDLEARRADLYRQADAKAAAAAQAARAAQAERFAQAQQNANVTATPAATGQNAGQSPAAQTVPGQPSAAPPSNSSASPN